MKHQLTAGSPHHLGARFDGQGTNFAVFSANATRVDLCIFSDDGSTEVQRLTMPERTGSIWHGYAPGLTPGICYGYRADGAYDPNQGHRFNHNKLLMDPYTRELRGSWSNHGATLGYQRTSPVLDLSFDTRDSAPYVPKSVVSEPTSVSAAGRLHSDEAEALIYEAHVKGLTMEHARVAEAVKGTYDGLASEPILDHLNRLGVTAIELLPVHSFIDDGFLKDRRLRNYWGYNSIGFFAPEPRYFGPLGFAGFRQMVDRFHDAGIEVILDVVYNHTAEGDQRGPTLCYRGLDNASYYRLSEGQPRYYANDTGCGNTLNITQPYVLRMVMDSLRFWANEMGVDGFRFDLATVLGREAHGFDRGSGFFDALRQDPVLATVKLIAEPWDIGPGGYQLGQFPAEFHEWNDSYRDTVRRYWRGDQRSAHDLGARLLGSAARFDWRGRRAWSSVNLVTSHDGFTLADVTRYNERHNLQNGENGADGHSANFSDNCGVEGETDDAAINQLRARRQRNMLATLFLSQGTPMLLAGDEIGNSQLGNNNAYAQDNTIGWINWADADDELLEFVAQLARFRREQPCVRQTVFLHGERRPQDDKPDVEWVGFDGAPLAWDDSELSNVCLLLRGSANRSSDETKGDAVFIAFNREDPEAQLVLPGGATWRRALDTALAYVEPSPQPQSGTVPIEGHSVVAFVAEKVAGSQ